MNRLASRVAQVDERLASLYRRLAQNNIEQEEGIFTSLANLYNLFSADINVDQGKAIRSRARALTELFQENERRDRIIRQMAPGRIYQEDRKWIIH